MPMNPSKSKKIKTILEQKKAIQKVCIDPIQGIILVYYNSKLVSDKKLQRILARSKVQICNHKKSHNIGQFMFLLSIIMINAFFFIVVLSRFSFSYRKLARMLFVIALISSTTGIINLWRPLFSNNTILGSIITLLTIITTLGGGIITMYFPIASSFAFFSANILFISFRYIAIYIIQHAQAKTRQSIEHLLSLRPSHAQCVFNGKEQIKNTNKLSINDVIRIRPGEQIPAGGIIIKGTCTIIESSLEKDHKRELQVGDYIPFAATNIIGSVDIRITELGNALFLHQQLSCSKKDKSAYPLHNILYYALSISILTTCSIFILLRIINGPKNFFLIISIVQTLPIIAPLLVIGDPFLWGLIVPLFLMWGKRRATKDGILIRNSSSFLKLYRSTSAFIDKTGSITLGEQKVLDVKAFIDRFRLLYLSGSAALLSEHSISRAIVQKARNEGCQLSVPETFMSVPGKGISATLEGSHITVGNFTFLKEKGFSFSKELESNIATHMKKGTTVIVIGIDQHIAGVFVLTDQIKSDAAQTIQKIKQSGITPIMITGDNKQIAATIAQKIGIEEYFAEIPPNEKSNKIKELQSHNNCIVMIGDGINDVPALQQADVGISMSTGTDISITTSDIMIIGKKLSALHLAHVISKKSVWRMRIGIICALGIYGVGIPSASLGVLSPLLAALVMTFATIMLLGISCTE